MLRNSARLIPYRNLYDRINLMNALNKKRVSVLRGGPNEQYAISMQTGFHVMESLSGSEYDVHDIIISKKGEWLQNGFVKSPEQALLGSDVVFIALHGPYGEDGTVQRILERYAIPYTGSGSFTSAVAMNKVLTKEYLKKYAPHILIPPYLKLTKDGIRNISKTVQSINELFGPDYIIKPVNSGSTIGVMYANQSNLSAVISDAFAYYDEIIIEKRIFGIEATVGIVEEYRGEKYYPLPVTEILIQQLEIDILDDPAYSNEKNEICPARFSKETKKEISFIAQEVHQLLGITQYSKSDFIVADDGIYFLEINTLPVLSATSSFTIGRAHV